MTPRRMDLIKAAALVGLSASCVLGGPRAAPTAATATAPATVMQAWPALASGGLMHARLAKLPEGTVLSAGKVTITEKDVAGEIAKSPQTVRAQLTKNAFFVLEQMTTRRLLLIEAKADAAKGGQDSSKTPDNVMLQQYLQKRLAGLRAADKEVRAFYEANKDAVGGATFEQVKGQIESMVRQQKQQQALDRHVRALGQRTPIRVSAAWVKAQAVLALDNPVDKARRSGRPSLVDFGAKGCRPCDMLAPILKALRTKYAGKANVVFVSVRQEQILAARYGIRSIPVQVFFDKDGKEVLRHTGFWPQEALEKQLAEMGAR